MTDCFCRRGLPLLVRPALLVPLLLALLLVGALSLFPSGPAHAQEVVQPLLPSVTVEAKMPSGESDIPKGATATFVFTRSGDTSAEMEVFLETREPNRFVQNRIRPNNALHFLKFGPGQAVIEVTAPVLGSENLSDSLAEQYPQTIVGEVRLSGEVYQLGDPYLASIPIRDATDDDVIVSIAASVSSIAEGDNAEFTLTRTGGTASTLTATVRVEDPDQAMRGNHWDPATEAGDFSQDVTFAAGAATTTQIHRLDTNEGLVGASIKAGYDGK